VGQRILLVLLFCLMAVTVSAVEVQVGASPVKVDIYGIVLSNTFWNSNGVVNSDVPLWVVAPSDVKNGDKEFGSSARQSRLGFKMTGPDVGKARLTALVEMDFYGGFPASGQAPSFPDMRLRLGYVKLDWGNFLLEAGQDWIVISPLNPVSVSHLAVVGFCTSGNLWLRYPQLRIEASRPIAGGGRAGITAALIRPVGGSDVPAGGTLTDAAGAGERSSIPFTQARLFYTRPVSGKTLGLGLGGHYGRENHRYGVVTGLSSTIREATLNSWAVAGDFQVPLGKWFSVQGEFFDGSNLDSFQGGINQGTSFKADNPADPNAITAIDTRGGWVQFSLTLPGRPDLSFHVGYGIDDPEDADLMKGQRSENSAWLATVLFKPSKYFQTALEYSRMKTKYLQGGVNNADSVQLGVGFYF
jgi:hypothetical protein